MNKLFTLALAALILPLNRQGVLHQPDADMLQEPSGPFLAFKNTTVNNIFEPEKKSTKEWSPDWAIQVQDNIHNSEYYFSWQKDLKAYCTPNRKNNLRFFYSEVGFSVEPRTTRIPVSNPGMMTGPDEVRYKCIPNWKVEFNLSKKHISKGLWKIAANKAEYISDKITVQYINSGEGMRQNFIVHQRLSENDDLTIDFSIKTKLKISLKNNQLQFQHNKNIVLHYEDLKVWDATHKLLPASFKKNSAGNYCIQVDAKNAVYPITVDPLSTTPSTLVESNQANAQLGFSVSSAGDVNGDGYSDIIAGVPGYDNLQADEGAAFIFHGSATGVSTVAAAIVESNQTNARLGIAVSTAGDVNGDGYSDVIVGANLFDGGQMDEGAAYIYHGSATGINTVAAVILESNQNLAQMGLSVASAGDVNGDGYSDVIAGAWLYDNPEINEGVAFVYHGSATGISTTVATTLEANQPASNYGISVAGAGDVNGDGYSDVIVGAEDYDNGETDEGAVFIYHGSAAGINNVAVTVAESNLTLSQFGYAVSSAGDVNGDGYCDVIVGAYLFSNGEANEGAAFIYHGSVAGINNSVAAILECNQIAAGFGIMVNCAGDINGDGYSDVIVGATQYDNVESNEGAAFIFQGSATGINTVAIAVLESNQPNAQMGRGVAGAGDVNGDGYSDVIVGAAGYDNPESNEGAAFVYHGSASGIAATATLMVESNQANARLGNSVASAGDVNGDGYSDLIVGVPFFDNGQTDEGVAFLYYGSATGISATPSSMIESDQPGALLGWSVASAGDVNGDGYSDVIIGATSFDNGTINEGAAFIYHGSAAGINTAFAALLECNQANSNMGVSVASAGDVNGDGYSDVIVGANRYDNPTVDEGAVFVYHGSATGVSTIAAAVPEGNQASSSFGRSVSSAGDVNGDGYSDVIVGSTLFDNGSTDEGVAFIFHGSATGINTTAATMVESNQASAWMGYSVAGAGDVNGDGYSDVIVGAIQYDNGSTDEGAAFVYHGSATGVINTATTILESNQTSANMGISVAGAGDVNGDGYSDVIAGSLYYDNGETDEGAAFVYHGSPTGINNSASATLESNQAGCEFGVSVACAGDVNADGYSDIVAGADLFSNGSSSEGAAFVYYGNNSGLNIRNNLRLYNTDLSTPVNSSNFISGNFGAGLYAKSFLGRDSGKIVWETRLSYNAYSGTPITNSTFFTSQQAAYTDLGLTGYELKNIITKLLGGRYTKLRARIKYNPAKAITGQVYSPWRHVSSIIDANNLGALPIDLISFNTAWLQKGKTARLDFKTDKESGICCFDIEKSDDGFNFYSIGTLPAKNISGIQSYAFIDAKATGENQFYRIKIKATAGQVDYSNIQQLQHKKATEILVFPNPATEVLQLQLNKVFDKMNVQVINSAGQMVKQMQLNTARQIISIPVQNLLSGKYWLILHSGEEKQVLQFMKQ